MSRPTLFQYAILWHPTEKQSKEPELKSKIIGGPLTALSISEDSAAMLAAMDIQDDYKTQLEQIEIVIRPF